MYGLHLTNTGKGVSVLQHQDFEDEHWDLEGENSAYGQALRKSADLDWDQLTYITASAEAHDRLKKDSDNYRQQKEEQHERERQEQERQRQQRLQEEEEEEPPINLAGLEALKRGFGLRSSHGAHLLAPSASRKAAAAKGATNARLAADTVVAAALLVEDGDLKAVTEEILARVRAQDAAEAELLPPPPADEEPAPEEEVKYKYHYGHSKGMAEGEMDVPCPPDYMPDMELLAQHAASAAEQLEEATDAREERLARPRPCQPVRGGGGGGGGRLEGAQEVALPMGPRPGAVDLQDRGGEVRGVRSLPTAQALRLLRLPQLRLARLSLHGAAAEPEAKPKPDSKSDEQPAKASTAEPPVQPEPTAEPAGDASSEAASPEVAGGACSGQDRDAPAVDEEDPRQRRRPPSPKPEEARGRGKLSYKERMKKRLEDAAKRREEGQDNRRYEWADTGEVASSRDAKGIFDKARREIEEEMEAQRPPSPRLDLPEDFCPLCHQITTGAKAPLCKGGHTFKAGCRRAKAS
eukprot:CAMPEP_0175534878 /NCGR_PEP_ID=MMETSP0096-20121207/23915_1 /TAXON_ID=311494 /ORGANISM="Alexandrium monilatum, Strain CCMP3105" /LENGTH=521 /DNA_ID=CAMNT_0016837667 /DNA_START=111 /DNA_END=1676 /DNA_ORIENTATION=+